MTIATLRKLAAIINAALDTLERELAAESLEFPTLDAPYDSTAPPEGVLERESAAHAIDLIVAASSQLCASVRKPTLTMVELAWQHMLPAALRFLTAIDVIELLADVGPQGMHVQDIAQKADVDSEKLAHALRFCATYHVFTEVAPDVFANNRLSSVLNKGKSYDVLQTMSGSKYEDTNGHAAWLELNSSTFLPAAASLTQHNTDPRTKFSKEPTCTALARGAGFEGKSLFAWLEEPQNGPALQAFGVSMRATEAWETQDAILEAFDWSSLPEGSVVVDIGGGIGNIVFPLYERFPHLRFEVQDRGKTCMHGQAVWNKKYPDAIASGRVTFREHNFFEAQPRTDAAVFLIRHCVHNWADAYAVKILQHLRNAAQPSTRLVVAEHILPYACAASVLDARSDIPGASLEPVPEPLLANLGRVCGNACSLDQLMQSILNAKERTLEEHARILEGSAWKIERVNRVRGDRLYGHIVAAPQSRVG
ncbi:S-adenosyl-L-methionine-dependent methyltransferase [Exidia glandulosa HHB12029]|uniref:S-adenosyl-L-methionine-dependent methyltransferase n=1 Tax=Exidia glandulosa HHB12029 TaxID=1314781 RepID=A0A165D1T2_EXIGL|nr:S-adenosyl-L-methionine-dependent methyltransferase [Exidia glandulosa HHB12029]